MAYTNFAQQCERTASTWSDGDYTITGTATLSRNEQGQLILSLSDNFRTNSGPDLDVYLLNSFQPDKNSVNLGALKKVSGASTYTVPADVKISDYQYVAIHCTQYNHFWGKAAFSAPSSACNESPLGIFNNKHALNISVYPNPFTNSFTIDGNGKNLDSYAVHDITGKLLSVNNSTAGQDKIQVSTQDLVPGVYLLSTTSEGKKSIQKLVKQ